jgi:hypothetical protein
MLHRAKHSLFAAAPPSEQTCRCGCAGRAPQTRILVIRDHGATMKPNGLSLSAALLSILIPGGTQVYAGDTNLHFSHVLDPMSRIPVTLGIVRPTNVGVHHNQALATISSGARTPWGPFASPFVHHSEAQKTSAIVIELLALVQGIVLPQTTKKDHKSSDRRHGANDCEESCRRQG